MSLSSTRLRVGFDGRTLVFPAGGVRRYVRELFGRLPAMAPDITFVAVDPPDGVALPPGVVAGPRAADVPTNLARAALTLPLAVRAARLDLFHAPAYTAPLWGRTPVVLTIHDVSYARQPEFYAHPAGRIRQWFYRHSAGCATHIITVSGFSRDEVISAYGIADHRVTAIHEGVGVPFCDRTDVELSGLPPGVRAPFVLHVGDLHLRRDLTTALDAVIRLRRLLPQLDPPLQFVCAGADHGTAGTLATAASAAGMDDTLVLTGPVSESVLVGLYDQAVALVYPSLYEGFGLPVVEAMACGLPVVAARAGAVPEVLGGAGILVPPGDAAAMASALHAVLTDDGLRAKLVLAGRARAAELTWERTARLTLDVYRAVAGRARL